MASETMQDQAFKDAARDAVGRFIETTRVPDPHGGDSISVDEFLGLHGPFVVGVLDALLDRRPTLFHPDTCPDTVQPYHQGREWGDIYRSDLLTAFAATGVDIEDERLNRGSPEDWAWA